MKKFYILNTSLFPNHGTHIISNRKLAKGPAATTKDL